MPSRKIDLVLLQKLRDSGMTQAEVSRELGVSRGAVSKNWKSLALARAQDVVFRQAGKINEAKLDAMGQLQNINEAISSELQKIQESLQGIAPSQSRTELQDAQIRHSAEIRKQLSLLLDIGKALFNVEEIQAFQKICLEEIKNENPECQARILKRIQSRRSSSGLPGFSEPRI